MDRRTLLITSITPLLGVVLGALLNNFSLFCARFKVLPNQLKLVQDNTPFPADIFDANEDLCPISFRILVDVFSTKMKNVHISNVKILFKSKKYSDSVFELFELSEELTTGDNKIKKTSIFQINAQQSRSICLEAKYLVDESIWDEICENNLDCYLTYVVNGSRTKKKRIGYRITFEYDYE